LIAKREIIEHYAEISAKSYEFFLELLELCEDEDGARG